MRAAAALLSSPYLVSEGSPKSDKGLFGLPWRQWPWWLVGAVALMEVVGHSVVRSRVPPDADWAAAANFLHDHYEQGDAFVAAPSWADPLMRLHVGDLIEPKAAARADLAPFERLWEVSIRGHRTDLLDAAPSLERAFGRVRVRRFDLGPSPVLYDFVDHIGEAHVRAGDRPCRWQRMAPSPQGGLWRGPFWPAERHFCGPRPWLWVGETILEDLHFAPRRCVWQHPAQGVPIRATFRDVPLGERLVIHGGLYYAHEREGTRPPVTARVLVDEVEIGRLVHRDGDGWKGVELDPDPLGSGLVRGEVTIEVVADDPDMRSLCWAASTRGPRREVE